jgi:hypothetical protein
MMLKINKFKFQIQAESSGNTSTAASDLKNKSNSCRNKQGIQNLNKSISQIAKAAKKSYNPNLNLGLKESGKQYKF